MGAREEKHTRKNKLNKKQAKEKRNQPSQSDMELSKDYYLHNELDLTLLRMKNQGFY
jgi:hypothetical protein